MEKRKVFIKTIFKSLIVLAVASTTLILLVEKLTIQQHIKVILPYYILWLILTIISIQKYGKPFIVFATSTIGDKRLHNDWNYKFAVPFLIGSVAIFFLQKFTNII